MMNYLSLVKGGPMGVMTLPWDAAALTHYLMPDSPASLASRHAKAMVARKALVDAAAPLASPADSLPDTLTMLRNFEAPRDGGPAPAPQAPPQAPGAPPQTPSAPGIPGSVAQNFGMVPFPQATPGPTMTDLRATMPGFNPFTSPTDVSADSRRSPVPMPVPRPAAAPSGPSPIPGYNPDIGNMADPSQLGGNLRARSVFDPATGKMMNDFYTASPWGLFGGNQR